MADLLPKLKLYLFMSIFAILLNLGYSLMQMAYNNTSDLLPLFAGFGTSFVPFANTIIMVFTAGSMPVEVAAFIGIFTGIISAIQTYLIIEIVLSHFPTVNV